MTRRKTQKKSSSPSRKKKRPDRPFGERELVRSLWKTMEKQERENPALGLLHERLEGSIKLVGLTGGIASGKSTAAQFLKEAGCPVIDADHIAREVVRPGTKAHRDIRATFGDGILAPNGEIDRERLAEIVFREESKRLVLESITHPEIFREIAKSLKALKKGKPEKQPRIVFIDAALLFESGLSRHMDKNILVRTDPETQLKRLMKRDGLSEAQSQQRILAQMPVEQKERLADFVIDNSGAKKETQRQVSEILGRL